MSAAFSGRGRIAWPEDEERGSVGVSRLRAALLSGTWLEWRTGMKFYKYTSRNFASSPKATAGPAKEICPVRKT